MTHPHDHPVRAELRAPDQQRADTLADALRPVAAPTGDAAEVLRLREECARLRAIVAGRTVPPTDAEIDAHEDATGGKWRCTADAGFDVRDYRKIMKIWANYARRGTPIADTRWWPLDAAGMPCAWPVVDGGESREGEGR